MSLEITPLPIPGAHKIVWDVQRDQRGWFGRFFCQDTLAAHGLTTEFPQWSASWNAVRGTLRGMHLQRDPYGEVKIVRCVVGAVFDVVVDLRPASPQFGKWWGEELSRDNRTGLYIPPGCGHGFLTLADDSEVHYAISTPYVAEAAAGIRWNDPDVGIDWPFEPVVLSDRDAQLPSLGTAPWLK